MRTSDLDHGRFHSRAMLGLLGVGCWLLSLAISACAGESPVAVENASDASVELTPGMGTPQGEFSPPKPPDLCSDYPNIIQLGNLQLAYYQALEQAGQSGELLRSPLFDGLKADANWFEEQMLETNLNSFEICGIDFELWGQGQREMRSFEGIAVCSDTLFLIERNSRATGREFESLSPEIQEAMGGLMFGYVDYCDNDFLEQR